MCNESKTNIQEDSQKMDEINCLCGCQGFNSNNNESKKENHKQKCR